MALIKYTASLRSEYGELFDTCRIAEGKLKTIENTLIKIHANKHRYDEAAGILNIPWYVIAAIHYMESSLNFNTHLHNGDLLTARTIHVPSGRPADGDPPFTWQSSAVDALKMRSMHKWRDWSISGILFKLEEYNGWGYRQRHSEVLTPYLWSFSNKYKSGKYTADGLWSVTAVSNQCGAAVLLRRMAEKDMINFSGTFFSKLPLVFYSKDKIEYGEELQQFLNKFPGIFLLVDGKPVQKTSEAFKLVTGNYLPGDPRNAALEIKKEFA